MNPTKIRQILLSNIAGKGLLWIMSMGYASAVFVRNQLYAMGFLKIHNVNSRVVCIGNITAGGTGKTTAVLLAAKTLAKHNVRVSVVSRGYKRDAEKDEVTILQPKSRESWEKTGDEPFMMHESLKDYGVPILVSANRVLAAQTAVKHFHSQVILLDDGFQHLRLVRDMDIVLIDARNPFGNDQLLPFGTLREYPSALERAGLLLLTHCDQADVWQLEEIKETLRRYNTEAEILESVHKPEHYFDVCNSKIVTLGDITGEVTALSAIGEPESFENTLKGLGLTLNQIWRYPDHHPYTLEELESAANLSNGLPIITTYKDFTKFPEGWREILKDKVYVLSIQLTINGGEEKQKIWLNALNPKLTSRKPAPPKPPKSHSY